MADSDFQDIDVTITRSASANAADPDFEDINVSHISIIGVVSIFSFSTPMESRPSIRLTKGGGEIE